VSKFFREKRNNDLQEKYPVNDQIDSNEVIVITDTGENLGTIATSKAISRAQDSGLDLVKVGVKDSIPVTKIMDFGKFLYVKKKQLNDSKKNQKIMQLKEIKLRPNIDDQDYKTKLNRAIGFFEQGKKVKFTLQFKGREISMINTLGPQIFNRITQYLQEKVGTLVEEKQQRGGSYWSKTYFVKNR
jgi:translation initiation factor IF-3